MNKKQNSTFQWFFATLLAIAVSSCSHGGYTNDKQKEITPLKYTVSMPDPSSQLFHVELICAGLEKDTINIGMPEWMPGYYQIMNYSEAVKDFSITSSKGENIPTKKQNKNTWQAIINKGESFNMSYKVKADKKFVANSLLDTTHGYIVPPSVFMYIDGNLNTPVNIEINIHEKWGDIATGLENIQGKEHSFHAPNFDILYDCPILIGNLEELPPFYVNNIEHQFIGYNIGDFDKQNFINNLQEVVQAATDLMGDIPYNNYKFIGIGPGFGGIEHFNNTTVSFDGNFLNDKNIFKNVMSFLAHEYFHHYNVKRIRPYELGPFNYDKENRTNFLWVSEGLTVYYEYLIVRRAGVFDDRDLLLSFETEINKLENDQGRHHQSLVQSSYYTWEDGPFGNRGKGEDRSISYYNKGAIVGLILDFSIRESTQNNKSLDDVMRFVYKKYYKKLKRGLTDAEFQQACESIADTSLKHVFEYVYTTKKIDYNKYLAYAGLEISKEIKQNGRQKILLHRQENITQSQKEIYDSWMGK